MWQNFFDNPKKNYNPYMEKLKDYPKYIMYDKNEINNKKNKWKDYFENKNPIYLEIGSGNGNFTVKNAENHKNKNFIGIELKFKRLVLSAIKAKKRNLNNILFIRRWGQEIPEFIGEKEISGMYINFPDPWDGREKNRIIQESLFTDIIDKIMIEGGKIFFKTDHEGYYKDTLELLKSVKGYKVIYNTDDLHNDEKGIENIRTEFEELFTKKGIKTKYIEIEKLN
ncbi:tRNA (guanine-N7-)-methyltransferase [Hypnocyclicus thermotrophus]|uniref:tRNA (guanine-N(7)-)-methyltransferase n=1 Tax=Hypnocyclicus thermotrophus TaxID=1627895 RepID=A0AA46DY20_9FUSO|nr:tRNA (guanosine(46)-N7)-methyltransferase TrmB [Hypnocyclicus thermotrophus]TDT69157.1 tRNA (guanine-N7-)-methyltransferase [Hypnocyclicus thermotrophus]